MGNNIFNKKKIFIAGLALGAVFFAVSLKMFFSNKYNHNVTYVDYPSLAELKEELGREKTFIEHMNKYPKSLDVLRTVPRLRKFCKERTYFCLEFLRYLNNHSGKAKSIYSSPCPAKRLIEFFSTFEWK